MRSQMQDSEQKGRSLGAYGWQLLLSGSTFFYMRGRSKLCVIYLNLSFWILVLTVVHRF